MSSLALAVTMIQPAVPAVLAGADSATLPRQPLTTPEELASPPPADLQFADPTAGLATIDPPVANSGGGAQLSYPLVIPKGRGLVPELAIEYDSGSDSSWVGQGWDLGVGEISTDTSFGVPRFCPRTTTPTCGSFETESYRLNGELLMPAAVTSNPTPRVSERHDFTRQVETEYDRIVRHGTGPADYSWEVTDKAGNVFFHGMHPDNGGPLGGVGSGSRTGDDRNDKARDPASILSDRIGNGGNGFTWYLTAQRDVGVNMIRYSYDTVYFKATQAESGNSTRWSAVSKDQCGADDVCAKHVYLSKIFYTGAAEASGEGEDPAYEIDFIRGADRVDATIDARGGFLDLDPKLLTEIKIGYQDKDPKTGVKALKPALSYQLAYGPGLYGKTQLLTITQEGCAATAATTGCVASTKATHTFSYYDDTQGKTLGTTANWDTNNDQMGTGRLEGRAGALGMSASNNGDGHLYLGFNPLDPSKTGSFGGSLTFNGGSTESLEEFMDINGDSLPDKVFRTDPDLTRNAPIYYRLNTSKPSDGPTAAVTFGDRVQITGLDRLPIEHSAGFGGGIEAYFGVFGMFNVSGQWNWSDGYFNDVNGDGLPDFIKAGSVLFNHLECTNENDPSTCKPNFESSDAQTRVPLTTQAVTSSTADPSGAARREMLRQLSPPVDTVKRWVAPYDGTVTINSGAVLLPCQKPGEPAASCPPASIRLAIQYTDTEIDHQVLTTTGESWAKTVTGRKVAKGEAIYFRMGADPTSEGRGVAWDPSVTYTAYDAAGASSNPPTDVNGLSQKAFTSSGDFTLAGRPGAFVGMPNAGTALFTAIVDKKNTSDDVRPTVALRPLSAPKTTVDQTVTVTALTAAGALDPDRQKSVTAKPNGTFCVADGAGTAYGCFASEGDATAQLQVLTKRETGKFRLSSTVPISAPTKNDKGLVIAQDNLVVSLAVDSPIDLAALTWTGAPRLCYSSGTQCDPGKADIVPPVDTDFYPENGDLSPRVAWTSGSAGDVKIKTTFDIGDLTDIEGRDVFLTVKTTHDGYVLKRKITIPAGATSVDDLGTLSLAANTDYWFDLSVRNPAVAEKLSAAKVTVQPSDSNDPADVTTVPVTVNSVGRQGYFPLPYRGWGGPDTSPMTAATQPLFTRATSGWSPLTASRTRTRTRRAPP